MNIYDTIWNLNNKCRGKIVGQQIYIFDIQRPHREKDSSGTQQDINFSADMSNIQQLKFHHQKPWAVRKQMWVQKLADIRIEHARTQSINSDTSLIASITKTQ